MIEQTKRILSDLIGFPTVSADSNLQMIAYLANLLEDCGAKVDILSDESGRKANLFATFGPIRDGGIVCLVTAMLYPSPIKTGQAIHS